MTACYMGIQSTIITSALKTEAMCQEPKTQQHITLKEECLKSVATFCYLGSTINKGLDLSKEMSNRISQAAATYRKLQNRVWKNTKVHLRMKMTVYNVCIMFGRSEEVVNAIL